jgi:hypothetical protein
MKTYLTILCLIVLVSFKSGFCETAAVDPGSGHFSYSVEGDWPFGTVTGNKVQLSEPTQVGEGIWALMIELKDHNMEEGGGPSLYISIKGKEAPSTGGYPLSFGQESTNYTAMIMAQENTLRIISGSGLLDIIVSEKDKLEARFEFQPEGRLSTVKDAVVKGHFLAVVSH